MKFSKHNNPARKKRITQQPKRSAEYIAFMNVQMQKNLTGAENPQKRRMIVEAFNISLNP